MSYKYQEIEKTLKYIFRFYYFSEMNKAIFQK